MFQPLTRILFAFLAVAITAHAEGDTTTNLANSATGALTTVTQGVSAFSSSQQQMQSLVNQMSILNNLQGQSSPQLAALNQMKMNLSMAMSEAQMCVVNAKKDTSKYKKATVPGKSLETVEATCDNYGNMIDSLRKNADELNEANTKIACVRNLQNKINQIAETAKAPFKQLTEAAAKVWNTRDKIIKIHKNIADQITRDVDGKGGFRDQMGKLQKLALDMNDKVSAMGNEVESIKEARVSTANQWYYDILSKTQACYDNVKQPCFSGVALSASACVAGYIGRTAKDNPVSRAQAYKNGQIADSMNALSANKMQNVAQMINADVKDPAGFLRIMDSKFNEMINETAIEMQNTQFVGSGVSPDQLSAFMKARYRTCYQNTTNAFKAKLGSEGNEYKASLKAIISREKAVALQAKNLITAAKNQMTDFKTAFNKSYNRDLSMFAANCTANEDAVESVDCLRKMQAMLNSGINGHPEQIKLNNGSMVTIDAGTTAINIPNLQLDAQGQPTNGSGTITCAGFQECITVMSNARDSHEKAEQSETLNQEKFVEQSNSDISNIMGAIASSFTTMSEMITSAVSGMNKELAEAGVSATVETKEAKGEDLEKDDKTGLFKTPKSMKAAFAGAGSYSEMGDTADVSSSINERKGILLKKMQEAAKMKTSCDVKKSDYAGVANAIGSCDPEKVCKASNISKIFRPLENLFRKSQNKAGAKGDNKIQQEFDRCMRSAKSASPDDDGVDDEIDANTIALQKDDAKAERLSNLRAKQKSEKKAAKKEAVAEAGTSCAETASGELESLAGESRLSLQVKNNEIATGIGKISTACSGDEADKDEAATACESVKNILNAYRPSNNGETPISGSGDGVSGSKVENVIRGSGAAQ